MSLIVFPQFREEQQDSKYPFEDGTKTTPAGAEINVPNNVIIDAAIFAVGGGGSASIAAFEIYGTELTITVETTNPLITLTAAASLSSFPPTVQLSDDRGRPGGTLVFGENAYSFFSSIPAKRYEFKANALTFVASCFTPVPETRVNGVLINDTELLTGDIALIGENGVVVRNVSRNGQENRIRVDVIGVPLFKRKNCSNEELDPPAQKFLSTINNCPPDEFGNFIIATGTQDASKPTPVRVYPTNKDTLTIEVVSGR